MSSVAGRPPGILRITRVLVVIAALIACAADTMRPCSSSEPPQASDNTQTIRLQDALPYGREPIDYFSSQTDDEVARLQHRLSAGELHLRADSQHGYLKSLLAALRIPVESQVLVFSKTARNAELVTPQTPRAVYFNDDVSVGWVSGAPEIEIAAADPVKGVNFYTVIQPADQTPQQQNSQPSLTRRDQCLACHVARASFEIPGLLLKAFQTDHTGKPLMGYTAVSHELPYGRRWGGWFVTGAPPGLVHRGNLISSADNERQKTDAEFRCVLDQLQGLCRIEEYLTDTSDIVAQLVLAHQVHGLNLINRVGMEARLARRSDSEEQLARYLVFADEPELPAPLADSARRQSRYLRWFEAQGRTDSAGRSLRQFDLSTRVFRYRLSFLIYHRSFAGLPVECRDRVLQRLWMALSAKDAVAPVEHISPQERHAIVEIVGQTLPTLPDFWCSCE